MSPTIVRAGTEPPHAPFIELYDARSDPLSFLERTSRRYGDLFTYALDGWRAVVINDPALAREALKADGEALSKEGTPDLMMLRPMLGRGLMTNEGEDWRLSRQAAQPTFAEARIEAYAPSMLAQIDAMLARWRDGGPAVLDLEREFNRLTLQVVGQCLMGAGFDDSHADLGQAVETMNRCVAHFDPADSTQPARFAAAHARLHGLMQSVIDQRIAGDDLLAALERRCAGDPLDPERMLRDEIVTFIMAGHETTAKALTWSLHLLALHPEIAARVRTEAQAAFKDAEPGDALERLSYTWQVLQEVMRLYPPVWLVSRRVSRAMTLGGWLLPEGTLAIVSPWLLHRRPDDWDRPLVFDPERFGPGRGPREAGAYMPFGAGQRVCIGRLFAAAETTLALARIIAGFDCRHAGSPDIRPEALVTLRPQGGMPMHVRACS